MRRRARAGCAIAVIAAGAAAVPGAAQAAIGQVFAGRGVDAVAVSCAVQSGGAADGQTWCNDSPSRARSWDDTAIDVSVAFPSDTPPAAGFPLVGIYHGWGGSKIVPSSSGAQRWLKQGYAVFSMTDRGWHQSCGTAAARASVSSPASCATGDIRLMDMRYEVRDAQYFIGLLVDQGIVDPNRIGAQGGSYGGMASSALGTLNNRTMLPDGTLVPWTSPSGTPIHIAAATPGSLGTELLYTQQPNGASLDYAAFNPYFGPTGQARVGVQKATVMNGFLNGAIASANPGAEMLALGAAANGPGPYDVLKPAIQAAVATHGSYNVDDSSPPAPMLLSDGFSDDFVPADESVRLYNRIRTDNPGTPVAMFFGDLGHARSQDKDAETKQLRDLQSAWMNHYVLGQGPAPQQGVTMRGITCPASAPSTGPYSFSSWAQVSSGEIRLSSTAPQTIAPTGSLYGDQFSAPDGDACASSPAADNPTSANYRTDPATGDGYDVAGSTTLLMRLDVVGESDQLAARLLDVAPDGTQRLIARGLLRPQVGQPNAIQVLQLHPNLWHVGSGHVLKLELLGDDRPYSHVNVASPDPAAQHAIQVRALQLRIPTMQGPGASGGLVQAPLPRYLPPGYTAAADFAGHDHDDGPGLRRAVGKGQEDQVQARQDESQDPLQGPRRRRVGRRAVRLPPRPQALAQVQVAQDLSAPEAGQAHLPRLRHRRRGQRPGEAGEGEVQDPTPLSGKRPGRGRLG